MLKYVAIDRYIMVHISHKKLKIETFKQIQSRFAQSIALVRTGSQAVCFLEELLGEEEQLMLAKRIAVVYMFAEEISAYRIAQVLSMSTSTVNRMRAAYDNGEYETIKKQYLHKNNRAQMWKDIEVLLRLGMPPMGKGRWKWFYDLEKLER